jgi:hypothetical protein
LRGELGNAAGQSIHHKHWGPQDLAVTSHAIIIIVSASACHFTISYQVRDKTAVHEHMLIEPGFFKSFGSCRCGLVVAHP